MADTTTTPAPKPPPPQPPPGGDSMGVGRVLGICVLGVALLAAIATVLGGLSVLGAHGFARDADGAYAAQLEDFESSGAAIRSSDVDLDGDPGPDWVLDRVDASVWIEAEAVAPDGQVFIGIADADDLERYLDGVAQDVVAQVNGRRAQLEHTPGTAAADPTVQTFWVASASGPATQRLDWDAEPGDWAAVVMNADGSRGIAHEVRVGVATDVLLPIGLGLVAAGLLGIIVTIPLIGITARSARRRSHPGGADEVLETTVASWAYPVRLEARLDTPLSPWKWLVKWFLAIPHFIVLVFLGIGFAVATVVAFFAILFTGRYPSSLFAFTSGVLRWSWRVSYYASSGGLGTDRYPPFTLRDDPGYPATLTIAEPGQLSRVKVLVKWWLLAIPHYVVLVFLTGWGTAGWVSEDGTQWSVGGGVLSVLALVAGGAMLFTRRYPRGLFDLIIGLNRWVYRVIAYAALMTDEYPPFRLDQGGMEPVPADPGPGDDSFDLTVTDPPLSGRVVQEVGVS